MNHIEHPHLNIEASRADDSSAMAEIEGSWNRLTLPSDAMRKTGALSRLFGAVKIKELLQEPRVVCLSAREPGGLRGFLVAYRKPLALEIYPTLTAEYAPTDLVWQGSFMYVKTVAVHPSFLGRGIGSKLLTAFRSITVQDGCEFIVARIAVEPLQNERSVRMFRACLQAQEIDRRLDATSGISWGLFKSAPLATMG